MGCPSRVMCAAGVFLLHRIEESNRARYWERLDCVKGVERMRASKDELYADVSWQLDFNQVNGGRAMTETMWRCDQVRAGQLYNRMMFDTQAEAEQFVRRMREAEPDQMFSIEAVEARQVWN